MASTSVLVDRIGPTARITINRPEARNSLNAESIKLLHDAFLNCSGDRTVRAVLLRGAGTEAFCAGADLAELKRASSPDQRRAFFLSIASLVEVVTRCPVPVVAEVQGFALAGGCGLVAAADIAIASEDAVFGLPEVGVGLAPMVVMAPLLRTIGFRAVSEMALTGERISCSQALDFGLISRIVAKPDLEGVTTALCATICSRGPAAVKASKRAITDITEANSLSFIKELADRSALVSIGAEASEGISAFLEKRQPSWKNC